MLKLYYDFGALPMLYMVQLVLKTGNFWQLLRQHFLQAKCPTCYPNNSIKTLKDVQIRQEVWMCIHQKL